ncbi:MAG: YicC family protein, partial [Crocinitomicaceae bacterium]|nr:YicC family protein [Flavobacteriia bacterium]NDC29000.1 YicC family protein [Crocinitomicaceae bacterium]NDC93383.1 YicC family protein [Flavobacteriales bacterium]
MLLSMTGFGKSNGVFESKKVSVEIRSLNSKGLDLSLKIASPYRDLETAIRKMLSENLDRGKVDIGIFIESTNESLNNILNNEVATKYYSAIKKLNESWGEAPQDYLSIVLRMPEVLNTQTAELTEEEKNWILNLVQETCGKLNDFRAQEGAALKKEFELRIGEIRSLLSQIEAFEDIRILQIKERILKGLKELEHPGLDQNRLEQEMIFYLEKLDVSEEKMRLTNHLNYFIETMSSPLSGKKLGFIAQELGREINTLGSKSNHGDMQRLVVEMKDNL